MTTVSKNNANTLLAAYLAQLATNPLRTKAITAGGSGFLAVSETFILAS